LSSVPAARLGSAGNSGSSGGDTTFGALLTGNGGSGGGTPTGDGNSGAAVVAWAAAQAEAEITRAVVETLARARQRPCGRWLGRRVVLGWRWPRGLVSSRGSSGPGLRLGGGGADGGNTNAAAAGKGGYIYVQEFKSA